MDNFADNNTFYTSGKNEQVVDEKIMQDSETNLGYFQTQSDMRVARWIKAGQALGPNLVAKLPATYTLTSVKAQI